MSQRRKRETKTSSLAHENTVVFLVSILGFTETSESEDGDVPGIFSSAINSCGLCNSVSYHTQKPQ